MRYTDLHSWNVTPESAKEIQWRLRDQVVMRDQLGTVRFVAGVDVGFDKDGKIMRAAVAVLRFPELDLVEHSISRGPIRFPYIPGLLSFRETPAVLEALGRLRQPPDLILCGGQGLAHPRRFGLACHIGVLSSVPTIGVAKTWLVGAHAPVGSVRGAWQPLIDDGDVVGAVLCTKTGVRPVYVSIGHLVSLKTAIDYVLRCTLAFRLPETTRQAHRLSR